jgi:hypothetical protein
VASKAHENAADRFYSILGHLDSFDDPFHRQQIDETVFQTRRVEV